MSKGKKRDYSLPHGIKSITEQSARAKKGLPPPIKVSKPKPPTGTTPFGKGINTFIGSESGFWKADWGDGGGYQQITTTPRQYGKSWSMEQLKALMEAQENGGWSPEQIKAVAFGYNGVDEVSTVDLTNKDTRTEAEKWADEWGSKNTIPTSTEGTQPTTD